MYNRLKSFFNKYNVVYLNMVSGSVDRLAMAFWTFCNKIQSYMDKGMFSCGVFIDLQKAFDTVDHDILFPQRSVLGPLLFLIYVNDIYNASNKLEFFLFVDDTNLLYPNKNLKSLETVMNNELLKIVDWLTQVNYHLMSRKVTIAFFILTRITIFFFKFYFKIFIYCKHCTQQTTYNFSNRERNSFHTD